MIYLHLGSGQLTDDSTHCDLGVTQLALAIGRGLAVLFTRNGFIIQVRYQVTGWLAVLWRYVHLPSPLSLPVDQIVSHWQIP